MTELIIERVDAGPAFYQFRVPLTEYAVISHNRGCSFERPRRRALQGFRSRMLRLLAHRWNL